MQYVAVNNTGKKSTFPCIDNSW